MTPGPNSFRFVPTLLISSNISTARVTKHHSSSCGLGRRHFHNTYYFWSPSSTTALENFSRAKNNRKKATNSKNKSMQPAGHDGCTGCLLFKIHAGAVYCGESVARGRHSLSISTQKPFICMEAPHKWHKASPPPFCLRNSLTALTTATHTCAFVLRANKAIAQNALEWTRRFVSPSPSNFACCCRG